MPSYRYSLERNSKKRICPACGKKTFVPFIDNLGNETLPAEYGRCDREINCGYFKKPDFGTMAQIKKGENNGNPIQKPYQCLKQYKETTAVYIPIEVLQQSQQGFEYNHFTQYLDTLFGAATTFELIKCYQLGTSGSRWKGATVFWWVDIWGKVRAGQVKQFDHLGHTIKSNTGRSHTTWIHAILKHLYEHKGKNIPSWLSDYLQQGSNYVSCLFGEHLLKENITKPVAIVEAPATAIVASVYLPEFIWLAAGSLSYLNVERTKALHGRNVVLFPDLSTDGKAFDRWKQVATQLSDFMFVQVSDLLEKNATAEERANGLDLRDFLTRYRLSYVHHFDENVLKCTVQNLTFEIKSLAVISSPGAYTGGIQLLTFELEAGGYCETIVWPDGEFYNGEFSESIKRVWGDDFEIGRIGVSDTYIRFKK
ncbi:DUF6371 domain-containing protein [Chitinophaga sp. Hz27]|uniref:DUF6371 domain-containing protein n=1 Tax=Chitinophaga sp. Hz27 TaxID=3347169 RepID=UPI0035DEF469